jgi:flagellar motor switch/type III secretory pathway protein FliN
VDEDASGAEEAFPIDFYEYLVNHEITLDDGPKYHICTQHEAAESVVRAGTIPATFSCPLGRSSCPMRRLLAIDPGRSLRLDVHVAI